MSKSFSSNCCLLLSFLVVLGATLSAQTPQWERLPPTPELPKPDHSGTVAAGELILPNVSHFALLQDPEQFNEALLHFLSRP